MKQNIFLSAAIILLAAAIVFSGLWIGRAIERQNESVSMGLIKAADGPGRLMTLEEAAASINMPVKDFEMIIQKETIEKQNGGTHHPYEFVPYIVVQGKKYFNYEQLMAWLDYSMKRGARYN